MFDDGDDDDDADAGCWMLDAGCAHVMRSRVACLMMECVHSHILILHVWLWSRSGGTYVPLVLVVQTVHRLRQADGAYIVVRA